MKTSSSLGAAIAVKKGCTKASDAAKAIGEGLQAFSLDFCRSTDLETESTGFYRCCFIKYEKDNQRQYQCAGVTSYGFWNIDETISTYESALGNIEIDSFDCNSSYLYVSLLLIFALLF